MKQLYRNRAVGNTAVFTALRERFCISLSKQEMAMLCIISRGVPADFWLPFAENSLGGYYCLRFEQKEESGVFWKNEDEMYKVAGDLKAFLQLLEIN